MDMISYQGIAYIVLFIVGKIGCTLVAFWPMNHAHIDEDISGFDNHLNISNVDLECGPLKRQAGSLSFRGNMDSYAWLPPSTSLDVQRSMTWIAYVYGGMPPNNQGPLLNFDYPCTGGDCKTWGTHIWRMGNILFFKVVMRNGTFTNAVSVAVLATDEWRFVAVTYNYTSGDATIWNDGIKAQTRNVGTVEQATQYEAAMGIKLTEDLRSFSGRLACVQIHNETLDMGKFNKSQLENDCFGISDCSSDPCVNGTCQDECFGYTCVCQPGYTGVHCEAEIDECESTECYNNGTCVDLIANFTCDCVGNFGGRYCENESDPTTIAGTTIGDTTIVDTTIEDTTTVDTTIVDTTIVDTTTIDTTIVDTTIVDTTIEDTTIVDTTIEDTTIEDTTIVDTINVDTTTEDTTIEDTTIVDSTTEDVDTTIVDTTITDSTTMETDTTTTNAGTSTEATSFYTEEITQIDISTETGRSTLGLSPTVTSTQTLSAATSAIPSSIPSSSVDSTTDNHDITTATNTQGTNKITIVTLKPVSNDEEYVRAKRINYAVVEAVGSEAIGTIMIVFVIAFIAFIVFLDSGILFRDIKSCFRNVFSIKKRRRKRAMYDFFTSIHPHLADPTQNGAVNNTNDVPTPELDNHATDNNSTNGQTEIDKQDKINDDEVISLPRERTVSLVEGPNYVNS